METTTDWLSRKVWLLNAIVWLCSVLPGMAPAVVPGSGFESDWQSFVAMGLLMVVPQVLLGPFVLHRAQQIAVTASPGRDTWLRTAPLVLWPAALGSISVTAVDMALSRASLDLQVWMFVALGRFPYYACHFAALAGFALAVTHRKTALLRQRQLAEARLRALRAQLQPHFLFNTLNGVAAASRTEPELATRMLALLGDLLRDTLRERNGELVALDEERRVLKPYVELQQLRFGERLRIEFDVPEDLRTAAVPDLLLQPLIENSVEHGIESRPEGGVVRIAVRRSGDQLEILVQDDGKGPGETTAGRGLGLSTTKERLRELFGDAAGVELTALPVGTIARVVLPYREVARAA